MTDHSARILAKLRDDPNQLDELVTLALDHLLERPLAELVDGEWLAEAITEGIRSSARAPTFERWVADRVEYGMTRADRLDGALGDRIPMTLLGPLERALGRPYQPDRELVRALIDHPSTRSILREILQANLLEFGKRMRAMVPDAGKLPGAGFASKLAGVAKGVASAVGGELERQLEPKVKSFVDDILGVTVDMMIDRVSSKEFAPEFSSLRIDVLHAMLGQPIDRLVAERHKYPATDFAADVTAILRALASWRGLGDQIAAGVDALMNAHGHESARQVLEGSGLEQAWRPQIQAALVGELHEFVAGPEFVGWFTKLIDE